MTEGKEKGRVVPLDLARSRCVRNRFPLGIRSFSDSGSNLLLFLPSSHISCNGFPLDLRSFSDSNSCFRDIHHFMLSLPNRGSPIASEFKKYFF